MAINQQYLFIGGFDEIIRVYDIEKNCETA